MSDNTKIEWTDATWNPITGCSVVSPGCTNCYAMKLAGTRLQHHPSRAGLTDDSKAGPVWNGTVRFNEQWLDQPLRWKTPRRIFVCAHGDLFHENVPFEWVDRVFGVMGMANWHTYQVLTKRPDRMRRYLSAESTQRRVISAASRIDSLLAAEWWADCGASNEAALPLHNVWLGVSVEDQRSANERIPLLLETPAAVRFVSCEPLLGPVDLEALLQRDPSIPDGSADYFIDSLNGRLWDDVNGTVCEQQPRLDWVIVGGESGHGARPMHPDWARSLRDPCEAAGVPFFFKQWGEWRTLGEDEVWDGGKVPVHIWIDGISRAVHIGKRAAGRLLDGREWNEMPEPRP